MDTFLHSVAQFILDNHANELKNCCMVFPNQRSIVYFLEEVRKINAGRSNVLWLPNCCTIDNFIHSLVNVKVASPITLLTTLYQAHQKLTNSGETFDKFYPWAQTILADFDDIDKYLADAHYLLQNVQDIKQIDDAIDYLTDEQIEAIRAFFSKTLNDGESELKKRFLDIWHILRSLYDEFHARLAQKGLASEGLVYRKAAETIGAPDCRFPYAKVFFVGFNAITKSERRIFEKLQNQGRAMFFWDYDNAYMSAGSLDEAGFFMRQFANEFKSPDGFVCEHDFDLKKKNIDIVASPTVSGQISVPLEHLAKIPADELSETALVLSDETLLMNVLEHTAPYVADMNVTMGYKIRNSVAGQWVELLIQLHTYKRKQGDSVVFYYKNVLSVLQHPFFVSVGADFASELSMLIKKDAVFQVPIAMFAGNEFANMVFSDVESPRDFAVNLLSILKKLISVWGMDEADDKWLLQKELVYRLILQIQQLDAELSDQNLEIGQATYFQLLRKCINSLKVPFEGEPVKGLQVMGFLETRNLDFRNLMILNVNEDTLPVSGNAPSFIPYSLRRAFGLPTHEEREAMYAYYFHRLIQRAQNITLTYFVGKTEGKRGEPSRYIMQLIYGNANVEERTLLSNLSFPAETSVEMEKNAHTMDLLGAYVDDGTTDAKNVKMLSPSALITYQKCPLQFYFSKVLRLDPDDDDMEENIDARQFGIIFHGAMQRLYGKLKEYGQPASGNDIDGIIDQKYIKECIDLAFKECIYNLKKGEVELDKYRNRNLESDLNGNNRIVYNVISKYVNSQLEYDKATANVSPLMIVDLENTYDMLFPVEIGGKKLDIKLGGIIDRIDKVCNEIRIIDYKTGSNDVTTNNIDDVFLPENIAKDKGILQTLIYCMVFDHRKSERRGPAYDTISSYLFKSKELGTNADFRVRSTKGEDEFADGDYLQIAGKVEDFVSKTLSDIFDQSKPFTQTADDAICGHCKFAYFCNKRASVK